FCVLTLTVSAAVAGEAAAPVPAPAQRAADPALEQSLGAEVEQFVRADRVSPPPPCQVLFVGSSSIVKWKETLASDMAPMRALARGRPDLHYIDVVSPMLENGSPKDIFVADGLHMVAAGYAIWTRVVRASLLPNVESEARRCARAGAR